MFWNGRSKARKPSTQVRSPLRWPSKPTERQLIVGSQYFLRKKFFGSLLATLLRPTSDGPLADHFAVGSVPVDAHVLHCVAKHCGQIAILWRVKIGKLEYRNFW